MVGEYFEKIYQPDTNDDWFLLQPNVAIYSLRLGGIEKETDVDFFLYSELDFPILNKKIKSIYTDDFSVYIQTDGGDGFSHGQHNISATGEVNFSIAYMSATELSDLINESKYDEDFKEIDL